MLGNLADVERKLGEYEAAIIKFERTIELAELAARDGGDTELLAITLEDYALLRDATGDASDARALRTRAAPLRGG